MSSPAITQAQGAPIVALVTTAETAVITTPAFPVNGAGQGVRISGSVSGATGAGVTSCQVRVRQGAGTGGAIVASAVFQEAQGASSFYSMAFDVLDTTVGVPAAPQGNPVYTVTVQQVGATGNGSATFALAGVETANAVGT